MPEEHLKTLLHLGWDAAGLADDLEKMILDLPSQSEHACSWCKGNDRVCLLGGGNRGFTGK